MEYAGLGRRLAAYIIDVLPLTLIAVGILFAIVTFGDPFEAFRTDRDPENPAAFLSQRYVVRDLRFVAFAIYFILMESSAWQGTVGMRVLGIRVVDYKGQRLTLARSFARNLCKLISSIPFYLGFLWAWFSKQNQTWHDLLARTYVIRQR